MTQLTGRECARYIQTMFTRIAGLYNLMNRLMTSGLDIRWRKRVIELAGLTPDSCLLDLGTETGDLAREALVYSPEANVIAADFTLEIMSVGRN
jgi:demethylmenaquinone methyltransferase/2-methoxy-6-polyprenyl-1,4-benzoquinol methylase